LRKYDSDQGGQTLRLSKGRHASHGATESLAATALLLLHNLVTGKLTAQGGLTRMSPCFRDSTRQKLLAGSGHLVPKAAAARLAPVLIV
jgi:hypothetical protein